MVRKTTVHWIPISLEMYIKRILLFWKDWRIERIPFPSRKFKPTGFHDKGIESRKDSDHLSRKEHS